MFCQCSPALYGSNSRTESRFGIGKAGRIRGRIYRLSEAARKLGRGFWCIEFRVAKVCSDFSLFLPFLAFSSPPSPPSSPSGIFLLLLLPNLSLIFDTATLSWTSPCSRSQVPGTIYTLKTTNICAARLVNFLAIRNSFTAQSPWRIHEMTRLQRPDTV